MGRFNYFDVVVYFMWVEIIDALNASCALSAERWYAGVEDVSLLDQKRRALIMRPDNEYLIRGERNQLRCLKRNCQHPDKRFGDASNALPLLYRSNSPGTIF